MVAVVVGHAHGSAVVGRLEDRPVIGAEREELAERIIAREVGVVESVLRIIVVELDLHAIKGNCAPPWYTSLLGSLTTLIDRYLEAS